MRAVRTLLRGPWLVFERSDGVKAATSCGRGFQLVSLTGSSPVLVTYCIHCVTVCKLKVREKKPGEELGNEAAQPRTSTTYGNFYGNLHRIHDVEMELESASSDS